MSGATIVFSAQDDLEMTSMQDHHDVKVEKLAEAGDPVVEKASFMELFKYADMVDMLLMSLGTLGAIANGCLLTMFSFFLGDLVQVLSGSQYASSSESIQRSLSERVNTVAIQFALVGLAAFFCSYVEVGWWSASGFRQATRVKGAYLRAILSQSIGYFDEHDMSALSGKITMETQQMQSSMGENVGKTVHYSVTFISALILSFVMGWQLSLFILGSLPVLIGAFVFQDIMMRRAQTSALAAYSAAAVVSQESLSNIRTVKQLGIGTVVGRQYGESLVTAEKSGIKGGLMNGIGFGLSTGIIFAFFGFTMWFGGYLIANQVKATYTGQPWNAGDVITVTFALLLGAMSLGQVQAPVTAILLGRAAARNIFDMLARRSESNVLSKEGKELEKLEGHLSFKGVAFCYPSRKEVMVLNDFSLEIPAGKTTALVGESGSGKSTVIQLIERFYEPTAGRIELDGVDISSLNIEWLRKQIGLVSQEPVLFACSILDNIAMGKQGGAVSREMVEAAARDANAHRFIMKLPQGYDTPCGERGAKLSGGQKQRIAIARAIVRGAKVLLLDEATSALDGASEKVVQQALDRAAHGRTTLVIAHRLSTIRDADQIAVVQLGRVVEIGQHAELLELDRLYAQMCQRQAAAAGDARKDSVFSLGSVASTQAEESEIQTCGENVTELDEIASESFAALQKENKEEENLEETRSEGPSVGTWRLLSYNRPEMGIVILGILFAGGYGCAYPIFALFFSRAMTGLQGAEGTSKMLTLKIAYFDELKNSSGALCSRLAVEANEVKGACAEKLGLFFGNLVTLVSGIVVGLVAGWKLSLVVIACLPIMTLGVLVEQTLMMHGLEDTKDDSSASVLSETLENRRTIAAFTLEKSFMKRYEESLSASLRRGIRKANLAGGAFGCSQAVQYWVYALGFWYGGKLVASMEWRLSESELQVTCQELVASSQYADFSVCEVALNTSYGFGQMMQAFWGIVLACMGLGEALTFAPDANKVDGERLDQVRGEIDFVDIHFSYPSRPEAKVLQGLTLKVPAGSIMALVGESGCGKSTLIQMVQRFYDPFSGTVLLDGTDVSRLDLNWYRSILGVVSQEPVLFNCSIFDNIQYGKADGTLTMEDCEAACRKANAHDFISKLPEGYATQCGTGGSKLSGGQKQRVAIARALVRDPKILLLDEATSALDTASERLVQEALAQASIGRTTLVIAHRLSTIQSSDCIAGISAGRVVELGTHEELLRTLTPDSIYANLVRLTQR
ncbi:hypothetical protein GUITHDRAFT_113183 [Guillardia theta CCMP2712]|uniref:ABC transporter n=1 Tax=Guillardia theta (strain CCMP2712) TaxID=905079 RepID=L1IXN8_GUITC|nr:hypothetical protein GUITHDRAFT_113183 [Guillardia theta CCMP2712]EKX40649.1 hypothetical protein GUITHDRAFT_113183 [Guillardia theta CCMP2712]|eukprot:XP_005827629.1 hypothetical protein GUITHDRAFT_113183 [Guillardia theta CCMP2712]